MDDSSPGVLLVNLGSPDAPEIPEVREYLNEFLSDPRVVDFPWPVRKAVLWAFILPFRPADSAEAYEKIWGPEGSPLIATTENVADKLRSRVDVPIEIGMRYGNPSIAHGIDQLLSQGIRDLFVIPQYPHYAMSSYETVVAKVQEVLEDRPDDIDLEIQPPFYDDPDYIDALVDSAEEYLEDGFDKMLFSYHGVPERHIKRGDPSGCYCLEMENCCEKPNPMHGKCYRHQVHATTWEFVEKVGIPEHKFEVTFQSRLGPIPWLKPFTADRLEELPSEGVKDVLVITPAFVADCLETIEEIDMEGREIFLEAGGKNFELVPCLNEHPKWLDLLERFVDDYLDGDLSRNKVPRAAE